MLALATAILAVTACAGTTLAALPKLLRTPWPGAAHGVLGVVGFIMLLFALRGPPRGVTMGAGNFGINAAALFGAALVVAVALAALRWRRRPVSMLAIGLHATFAVAGVAVLVVYLGYPA